jgi:two-component system, cell cycle sensor histidine kinase and response regulator CckA
MTKKTILLVEDDDLVRVSVRTALEGEYEVLTAKDGIEGLMRFDRHQAQIQLIITDLMMPRLGGELLVEMVRRTDAALPVIVMTGWTGEVELDKLLAQPRVTLLRKPFQIEQLIRLMADVAACET